MTFIGEQDGHSYRTKTINIMQRVKDIKNKPEQNKKITESYLHN